MGEMLNGNFQLAKKYGIWRKGQIKKVLLVSTQRRWRVINILSIILWTAQKIKANHHKKRDPFCCVSAGKSNWVDSLRVLSIFELEPAEVFLENSSRRRKLRKLFHHQQLFLHLRFAENDKNNLILFNLLWNPQLC